MGIKVKICGITNLKDAQDCAAAGCDAIGFVFYKKSPRYISPLKAREIASKLCHRVLRVGVFVDAPKARILKIAKTCRLDMLQFHGKESADFCRQFRGYKIIKAFRIKDKLDKKKLIPYKTFGLLFDAYEESSCGGTGRKFNWKIIKDLRCKGQEIFLSGGLKAGNIRRALKTVSAGWLDVSSGVEKAPGRKDRRKIIKFMKIKNNG